MSKKTSAADRPTRAPTDPRERIDFRTAETKVPCPICKKGMVAATVAKRINEILSLMSDGPTDDRTYVSEIPTAVKKKDNDNG